MRDFQRVPIIANEFGFIKIFGCNPRGGKRGIFPLYQVVKGTIERVMREDRFDFVGFSGG